MQLTEEQRQMVENNIKLVHFVINKYWHTQSQDMKDELFQEGCVALINAVKRYDESVGKFSTFAVKSIYLYITRQFNLVLSSQFKVNNESYKEAYQNIKFVRLDIPSFKDETGFMSETIEDKNDELEKFIHQYGAKQQARWVMRFASDEDYDFMLNYVQGCYSGKFNKKKWTKDYKRYGRLLRMARMRNKYCIDNNNIYEKILD